VTTKFIAFLNTSGITTLPDGTGAWAAGDAQALAAAQACCAELLADAGVEVAVPIADTPGTTPDPITGLYLNDPTATNAPRGYALEIRATYQPWLTTDPWFANNNVPTMIAALPKDASYSPAPGKPWNFGDGWPTP
jgi:hypothetical protein